MNEYNYVRSQFSAEPDNSKESWRQCKSKRQVKQSRAMSPYSASYGKMVYLLMKTLLQKNLDPCTALQNANKCAIFLKLLLIHIGS